MKEGWPVNLSVSAGLTRFGLEMQAYSDDHDVLFWSRLAATALLLMAASYVDKSVASDDIVAQRQNDMKEIAASTKVIANMFRSPDSYSSSQFGWAAIEIRARAGEHLIGQFATTAASQGSNARDTIATDRDRFNAFARDLSNYATKLVDSADKHPDAMSADMLMQQNEPMGGGPFGTHVLDEQRFSSMSAEHAFHLMLQTCSTCHSLFRVKE